MLHKLGCVGKRAVSPVEIFSNDLSCWLEEAMLILKLA